MIMKFNVLAMRARPGKGLTISRGGRYREPSHLSLRISALGPVLLALSLSFLPLASALPVAASEPTVGSSVSVYISCPGVISFVLPNAAGYCTSGNFTGVYTGVAQVPIANLTSEFYLAFATGGVKVTFGLTDLTSGKPLLEGVGYGSIAGGDCSSASLVIATNLVPTSNLISSGDKLEGSLNTTFTGTGTPTFCSGGSSATLISFRTMVTSGAAPLLASLLAPGSPIQTNLLGYEGVSDTYAYKGSAPMTVVVQGVVKDQAGNTVDVLSTSITLSPGAEVTAFLSFNKYPSGSYTVTIFALTSSEVPISPAAVAEVSV